MAVCNNMVEFLLLAFLEFMIVCSRFRGFRTGEKVSFLNASKALVVKKL
jgi:hypothetical protein